MKKHAPRSIPTGILLCAAAAGLIFHPQEVSAATQNALTVCTDVLLPNLFPFFVLSSMVVRLGLAKPLGRLLSPIMGPVFHLPGQCSIAVILGMIGGYPTGAKTAISLYHEGICTRQQTENLLAFCNNCGPAFILGVVGNGLFGSLRHGFLLLTVHFSAALLSGFLLNRKHISAPHSFTKTQNIHPPVSAAFTASVTESMASILNLSAFVICFSAITALLQSTGIPDTAARYLSSFLSEEYAESLLIGLLEMTCGIAGLHGGNEVEPLLLSAFLLGWGGLSVHCQVLSLLQDTDLSPARYFKGKFLHAVLSVVLMWCLLSRFALPVFFCIGSLFLVWTRLEKKSSGKSAQSIV